MTDIDITCTPPDGILTVSAETVAALDDLAHTLPTNRPWAVEVLVGRTRWDTIRLAATPALPAPEEAA